MTEIVRSLSTLPIPLILLLVIGVLLWRHRVVSRAIIVLATIALFAVCLPVVGRLLEAPLLNAAPAFEPSEAENDAVIMVPTAGIFADATGVWWPASTSIIRAVSGRKLHAETGLPMLLIGGSPKGESESEAMVVARAVGLVGPGDTPKPGIFLETAAQNSAETAAAAKPILDKLGANHVVLITSPTHAVRMSASLRHLGYRVSVQMARQTLAPIQPLGALEPYIPSADGLSRSTGAVREYIGILWYLLRGYLTVSDLRFVEPAGHVGETE